MSRENANCRSRSSSVDHLSFSLLLFILFWNFLHWEKKSDEIVSVNFITSLKNPFRFFCVVLKTTKVMASTFIYRKSSVCKKKNKTTGKKKVGEFWARPFAVFDERLVASSFRFVRWLCACGWRDRRERWNKRWKRKRRRRWKNKKKAKGGHPPNPLAIAAGLLHLPHPHFPTHSFTEKSRENRRETAMEMERGEQTFLFSCTSSLKRGGETRPVKAVSVTSSIASSSLTDSITHSSSSFSFSLVDVLGFGSAIRRKKKENKSLYHHQHTNGLNYLLIKI